MLKLTGSCVSKGLEQLKVKSNHNIVNVTNNRCVNPLPQTSWTALNSLFLHLQTSFVGWQLSDRKCPFRTASRNVVSRFSTSWVRSQQLHVRAPAEKGTKASEQNVTSLNIFSRDTLRRFNQSHIWRVYPATSCCCRRTGQQQEMRPYSSICFWIGRSTLLIRSNLASHL